MKHHILLTAVYLCGAVLTTVSCDNYDELYPQEYEKILMLKQNGEQDITLYTSNKITAFPISVVKTGSNTALPAQVTLRPMTAEELKNYNEEYGTYHYASVPTDCYSFTETGANDTKQGISISYEGTDKYKFINVYMNPTKVLEYTETLTELQQPVLPLVLVSETDSVSSKANRIFIRPEVIIPTIYFEVSGFKRYGLSSIKDNGKAEVNIPVTMPIDNQWDFNFTAEVDEQLLTDYNAKNGTNYQLLPLAIYTPLQKAFAFTKGNNIVNIKVEVDQAQFDFETEYVLPIKLTSSELEGVDIDAEKSYCLAHISRKIALTSDMLSSNSVQLNDGAGLPGLIDGDGIKAGSLFHSGYGSVPENNMDAIYGKYVDFHLPFAIKEFKFNFMSRLENTNGVPQKVVLYTSKDGAKWTELETITTMRDVLTAGGQWGTFGSYKASEEFTYLRFAAIISAYGYDMRTNIGASWNCQEFALFGK